MLGFIFRCVFPRIPLLITFLFECWDIERIEVKEEKFKSLEIVSMRIDALKEVFHCVCRTC